MMFKQKKVVNFALVTVLVIILGCGGGSLMTTTIQPSAIQATWRLHTMMVEGQSTNCPGTIQITQTHSIDCDNLLLLLESNGKYSIESVDDDSGTWSLNANTLALDSSESNNQISYSINSVSASQLVLSISTQQDGLVQLIFAKESQKIAFASTVGSSIEEIFIADDDGTNVRRLTYNNVFDGLPAISPNGMQIAFDSEQDGGGIFVINRDGTDSQKISELRASYWMRWSPDGNKIAFATGNSIYVIQANGSNPTLVFQHPFTPLMSPTWSPDSQRIAYSDGTNIFHISALGNSSAIQVVQGTAVAWNKLNNTLAIVNQDSLQICNLDGSNLQEIINPIGFGLNMTWEGNGRDILIEQSNPSAIIRVDTQAKTSTEIISFSGEFSSHPTTTIPD